MSQEALENWMGDRCSAWLRGQEAADEMLKHHYLRIKHQTEQHRLNQVLYRSPITFVPLCDTTNNIKPSAVRSLRVMAAESGSSTIRDNSMASTSPQHLLKKRNSENCRNMTSGKS